ncbi:uncharacterized protein I303_107703 [Kwoniella dejecticola CBS 10117]|uniref:Uncharacterized protein n=1 Tax=Kwoniella dejecticola CBS 10117 TaxID=1296121 RepID=A0A1A5ZVG2_9TREE|nr:uncharacterized protein I303_07710 [Kwoniella dejecticola CBS 10117]OBR81800.1 hypothetical protein I303_07710 [Kwoniella dejecticola CBS 10117]
MSNQSDRSSLQGATRQNAHPRLHALSKPYSRPSSFSGLSSSATMTDLANVSSSLGSPTKSPTKSSTTRPGLNGDSRSSSFSSLPRSGSDSSLFSGIKSILSRPLQWLATPTREHIGTSANKRDSFSSFGHDLEDPDSPSEFRNQKRIRRSSPSPEKQRQRQRQRAEPNGPSKGDYEPEPEFQVQGRAVSGFMLPPLSPNVTLKPKSHLPHHVTSQNPTNFSRPLGSSSSGLSSSKSMSYLDPPSDVLAASSPRKGGMLTRSKRVELSSLEDDDEHDAHGSSKGKGREEEKTWSPWKSRYTTAGGAAASAANVRPTTPSRKTPSRLESRDFTLPSVSPFKPPPSPLQRQSPHPSNFGASTSGLTRSATTANIRRAASVASDVSMGGGLTRSGSVRGLRQSGSMLFGSVNGDMERDRDDDKMSVDGEHRQREGSVLDWFMKDRWDGRAASPASVAASRRLGSAGPSLSHPPIRKGQLVWHEEEKAFVRESDLKASQAPPAIHKSEAERILHTLESMRKTPLTDARKGEVPSIIGQSSRTMRKTISVPLATAAAGDSAKQRRDKDRLGGDDRVSLMISPYGRRKVADQQARDDRRSRMAEDRDYRPSPTPTASDARSRSRSQASDVEMDRPSSPQKSPSPAPPPTPRRSSRLKKPAADEDAPTPKTNRRTKRGTSRQPEPIAEDENPQPTPRSRRTRKQTVDRGTSPDPPPPVPTITATAPSPGGPANADSATQTVSTSHYQPLADGERSRGGSSLRARSDVSKRTHVGAASYSRSVTPSSGRFSAREEDLPDMDELEQAKIPLPSFSGISFAGLNANPPANQENAAQATSSTPTASAPTSTSTQPSSSLGVPSQRKPAGPLARVGLSSTRPRASSPLAAGSIVAQPASPPTAPPASKSSEPLQPPANGFFALNGSAPTVPSASTGSTTPLGKPPASSFFSAPAAANGETSKDKSFSFGLGQPATKPTATESASGSGGIPDFFGKKSAPSSGTSTPASIPAFDFGLPKKSAEEPKAPPAELPPATFSFGKPAEAPKPAANGISSAGGFNFGAPAVKATEKKDSAAPSFSFGSTTPADAPKSTFPFGSSDKPAEPAKSTFSFGTPSNAPEPAKSTFSFGAPAASSAAEKPTEAPKPSFSFGTSSAAPAKAAEPAKPAFSFGNSSTTAPAPAAKPAEPSKPAFSFGAPWTNGTSTTSASNGFTFGKPAEKKDAPASNPFGGAGGAAASSSPSFTFGAPSSTSNSATFGSNQSNGDAAKSNPFGGNANATPAAAPATSGFTFGAPASTAQTNGTTPGFGSPAPAAQSSNPFGSASSSPALGSAPNPFGQAQTSSPAPASAAAPSFTFGQSTSASSGFGSSAPTAPAGASNPFGQSSTTPAAAPAAGGFNFSFGGGSTSSPAPAPAAASGGFGGFGQQNQSTAPSTPLANNASFTFGAAPQPSTPTTAPAQPFTFGGGGVGASTTPAAAPSSGFSFGAPTNAQQAQAPRFGSPAPGVDAGGFSLGANDGTPGSPGGRKVKGLPRRGAVKR